MALIVTLWVMSRKPQAPEYGMVIIWALVGIIVSNGAAVVSVTTLAAVGIVVVAGATAKWWRPAPAI